MQTPHPQHPTKILHWHILGAGAMGCLYAGFLVRNGQRVTLLLKDVAQYENFLVKKTITLQSSTGQTSIEVEAEIAAQNSNAIDLLLVTTKAPQVTSALTAIAHRLSPRSVVILLHNGMGVIEELPEEILRCQLLQGITTVPAHRLSPFHVEQNGEGELWLGNISSHFSNSTLLDPVRKKAILNAFGSTLKVSWDDNIIQRAWKKMAQNSVINPLAALVNCRNGALLQHLSANHLLIKLCHEAAAVLEAQEIQDDIPLLEQVRTILQKSANNYCSMAQDLQQKRQTEIAYINGYLVKIAKHLGIATPTHEVLIDLIHLREALQHD